MEVTKPCPICDSENCNCKASFIRYVQLLQNVSSRRVLSNIPASNSLVNAFRGAGVDKLNGYLTHPAPLSEININAFGEKCEKKYLKDRKPYLCFSNESDVIHLRLSQDQSHVVGYVTNPNRFGSWKRFEESLEKIIGREALLTSQVSRIDLNLDFNCHFIDLVKSIDLRGKRKSISYIDDSGCRTGMNIGKGVETVVLYDKAKESGDTSKPFSRLELRLNGTKLPTRNIAEIPKKLTQSIYFRNLIGVDVAVANCKPGSPLYEKVNSFISVWQREGYFAAKKTLNLQRNFNRDFNKFLTVDMWTKQPSELFKDGIKNFFI